MAGCAESTTDISTQQLLLGGPPTPVRCPTNQTTSTTTTVTSLGGLVSLDGLSISFPAGAVLAPTTITATIPASNVLEVDITANGAEHFIFELPIVVTLDYSRCERSNILKAPLAVWYWDPVSGNLLENMGGVDNKLLKTITFLTPHLSGYVMAN